ncbi:MAG: hypothetical protein COW26_00635 [Nitrosopumilales archaeon CG15_BIG_FIL_POST_REV_8_21_14_020_33_23]|nr:MAG: hypothetical protein COV65_02110 [Nitrosopumilales archaeon CG11_big_fil_rev_8_21_14_0_20_33_24]PIW36154.1 MAG: hypothetical protein COW26_00635 [Nitrosopumilales archaeon CG15_BIG_FIL_POST_REV_8_21_14_020_33_23]PIY89499.1 MAG: hypothetical protein COY74_05785 [Nitrosopumilales archaeon CG_4_10_14_0_8_um_filter_34_8]
MDLTTDIIGIIGAITGSVSLTIIIYRTYSDKPKLSFDIQRTFFMQPREADNFTTIFVELKVHNKGTKSTTIHQSVLSFRYQNREKTITDNQNITLAPNTTEPVYPRLNLRRDELEIDDKIESCVLTLHHTHGKKSIKLGIISLEK